jgi:N,N-dimethylformamidase
MAGVTKRVIGYCTPWSVAPGERVDFKVSLEEADAFTASLWRIVCGDDSPDGPGLDLRPVPSAIDGRHAGRRQPLRAGSCVRWPANAALDQARSFSLGLLLWPTAPHRGRAQAIASTWDEARGSGLELGIDAAGHLEIRIGSGERASVLRSPQPLAPRCWVRVHAAYDDRTGELSLACATLPGDAWPARSACVTLAAGPGALAPSGRPFMLAGRPGDAFAERCYDGKLESPCLSDRCLGEMELERLAAAALAGEPPPDLLGCWDFAADITGVMVRDVSGRGWHGETCNLPARGVTGHAWNGEQHDWRQAPTQ